MLIVVLLLKLITSIVAIKHNLKVVGYYLLGNLGLDVISQIIKQFQHYPKPYTGIGFILFSITTFCYLANAAWLAYCAGWIVKNKTLQQVSALVLISILALVLLAYPTLHGLTMLVVWYAFYATLNVTSISIILINLRKHLSLSGGLMFMLCLGGLIELIMVAVLSFPYWLVSVCNVLFYLTILASCALVQKYIRLLKP